MTARAVPSSTIYFSKRHARPSAPTPGSALRSPPTGSTLVPSLRRAPAPVGPPYAVRSSDPRLPALCGDVASRLRRVCADLGPVAFDRLVQQIALFHLRWEGTSPIPPEPLTGRGTTPLRLWVVR